jgi:chromosomal replication initiator protein
LIPTRIPPALLSTASAVYNVSVGDILGRQRSRNAVLARHAVIYTLRSETDLTLMEIGALLDRDHTSIIAAVASIEAKAIKSAQIALGLAELRTTVRVRTTVRLEAIHADD